MGKGSAWWEEGTHDKGHLAQGICFVGDAHGRGMSGMGA